MRDMEILSEMIKQSARVTPQEEYGKFFVVLSEPKCPDSTATIRNLPLDALIIKVDSFSAPGDIFNGMRGECKRADYVIISAEMRYILYIELKKKTDEWENIVKQLRGAECFVKYCQEIGKSFWEEKEFLNGYKHRFVSIGHTSIPKKKTRITTKSPTHDSPSKAMKIDWPNHLQFNKLVGALT